MQLKENLFFPSLHLPVQTENSPCVVKRAHYLPRAKILLKQRTIITQHVV
jgi:hypothetical protein